MQYFQFSNKNCKYCTAFFWRRRMAASVSHPPPPGQVMVGAPLQLLLFSPVIF